MGRRTTISFSVAGVVAVALVAGVMFSDWNMLKPYAERHLSKASGRSVSLAGDVKVALSLTPRVHIDHVRIANPPWAREKQMLDADAVEVTIDLRRLWVGEYYLPDVTLTRPRLALEISSDGRHNWYLDREQKDEKSALHVGRLQVDAGDIVFHDPAQKTEIHAKISTVNAASGQANLVFNATGRLRGLPLKASGTGGPVLALRDDSAPYPIKFHAAMDRTQVEVDGTVTGLTALSAADVQLALRGRNFAELYPLLRVALPPTPPYRIAGHLRQNGNRVEYGRFHGHMGSSDLAGNISVNLSTTKPSVTADVVSNTLDLADLGPLIGARPKTASATANDRVFPNEPFNVEHWKTIDMDVHFRGRHLLHAAQMPLDDFTAHAVMKDGVLNLDPLNFGVVGGEFSSKVTLDGRSDPLLGKVSARVRKFKLSRIAPSINLPETTVGDISADLELTGRGNSIARMLANADGQIGLAVTDGQVSKLMLKLVGLDLGGYMWTRLSGDRNVPIRCAVASFDAKHGVLDTKALVFDTTDTNVLGEGTINLADESLAMTIRPQPKQQSILSLRTPLHVTGTLRHPSVGLNKGVLAARGGAALGLAILNPLAALVPLIETGPGKDSDCAQLIASVRKQANAATPPSGGGQSGLMKKSRLPPHW